MTQEVNTTTGFHSNYNFKENHWPQSIKAKRKMHLLGQNFF